MMRCLLSCCFVVLWTSARADGLPVGVGAYQLGYRLLSDKGSTFDRGGRKVDIGERYKLDLSGTQLLSGSGGEELQLLANELQKFEAEGGAANPLLNQLTLGEYELATAIDVDSTLIGFAYGVRKGWNVFMGVPWVRATVDCRLEKVKGNNASEVSERLGNLAFTELRDGLQEAGTVDAALLLERLQSDFGYLALDHWEHEGFGDVLLGARYETGLRLPGKWRQNWMQDMTLTLPTGYTDDPNMLQDADIGGGAVALKYGSRLDWTWKGWLHSGIYGSYEYAHQHRRQMRVPIAGEKLVTADRKADVTVKRGDVFEQGIHAGARYRFVSAQLDVGKVRGFGDRYSGSLEGNYGALTSGSDEELFYDRWSLQLDSTKAYRHKRFPVPAILGLSTQISRAGRNRSPDTYYQMDVTGFFQ